MIVVFSFVLGSVLVLWFGENFMIIKVFMFIIGCFYLVSVVSLIIIYIYMVSLY